MLLAVMTAPGAGAALLVTCPRMVAVLSCATAGEAANRDVANSATRTPRPAFRRRFEPIMSYSPFPIFDSLQRGAALRGGRSTRARSAAARGSLHRAESRDRRSGE